MIMEVGQYIACFFDGQGDRMDEWAVCQITKINGNIKELRKVKSFYKDIPESKQAAEELAEILNNEMNKG
jgi:hypothetical protein